MAIQYIRPLLDVVPELEELTKVANMQADLPTGSISETLLSAAVLEHVKRSGKGPQGIGFDKIAEVNESVDLYGLRSQVSQLGEIIQDRMKNGTGMTKVASQEDRLSLAQEMAESMMTGVYDREKVASVCQKLVDTFGEESLVSLDVLKYAGIGMLNKEAALASLRSRHEVSGAPEFEKIAQWVEGIDVEEMARTDLVKLGNAISQLDTKYHLSSRYDFFKQCVVEKTAALSGTVSLQGKSVPLEKIVAIAPSLEQVLGSDIVSELITGDQETIRAVIESLPIDLKSVLATYV